MTLEQFVMILQANWGDDGAVVEAIGRHFGVADLDVYEPEDEDDSDEDGDEDWSVDDDSDEVAP